GLRDGVLGQLAHQPGHLRSHPPPACRWRHALGVCPVWRLKAALNVDFAVKPQSHAISRIVRVSLASASRSATASTRLRLIHSQKFSPIRRLITADTRYSG